MVTTSQHLTENGGKCRKKPPETGEHLLEFSPMGQNMSKHVKTVHRIDRLEVQFQF